MVQEITTALIGIGSAGGTLLVVKLVNKFTKSRSDKKREAAHADIFEASADIVRVDTSKIKDKAIKDLVTDTYLWLDEMNDSLNKMRKKNLELEKMVFELTKRAEIAERERNFFKDILKRLIDIVVIKCPDIDVEEFRNAINVN